MYNHNPSFIKTENHPWKGVCENFCHAFIHHFLFLSHTHTEQDFRVILQFVFLFFLEVIFYFAMKNCRYSLCDTSYLKVFLFFLFVFDVY